jgi:hypothetical protein
MALRPASDPCISSIRLFVIIDKGILIENTVKYCFRLPHLVHHRLPLRRRRDLAYSKNDTLPVCDLFRKYYQVRK